MSSEYKIHTEWNGKKGQYNKVSTKGQRIRIDLYNNFPIWKVKELVKLNNWKVVKECGHTDIVQGKKRKVIYIDII